VLEGERKSQRDSKKV